ncbi:terminase large subunit domain-containing protein, partial [Streptococcus uberis]
MEISLPQLRADQQQIALTTARIKMVACGRRWGKSTLAGTMALTAADVGGAVAWVAPTYANSRPMWRFLEALTTQTDLVQAHKTDRTLNFARGGRISVFTADNDIALRGESFDYVFIDEAARISEATYQDVILPTLADRDGHLVAISTPKGRNWFWRQYIAGQVPNERSVSFTAPSSANPMPNIRKAADLARDAVSNRTYRQEWLAEFVDDAGGVF